MSLKRHSELQGCDTAGEANRERYVPHWFVLDLFFFVSWMHLFRLKNFWCCRVCYWQHLRWMRLRESGSFPFLPKVVFTKIMKLEIPVAIPAARKFVLLNIPVVNRNPLYISATKEKPPVSDSCSLQERENLCRILLRELPNYWL